MNSALKEGGRYQEAVAFGSEAAWTDCEINLEEEEQSIKRLKSLKFKGFYVLFNFSFLIYFSLFIPSICFSGLLFFWLGLSL